MPFPSVITGNWIGWRKGSFGFTWHRKPAWNVPSVSVKTYLWCSSAFSTRTKSSKIRKDRRVLLLLGFLGLCQMVFMLSKTSLRKRSGFFCLRRFQIGAVTHPHHFRRKLRLEGGNSEVCSGSCRSLWFTGISAFSGNLPVAPGQTAQNGSYAHGRRFSWGKLAGISNLPQPSGWPGHICLHLQVPAFWSNAGCHATLDENEGGNDRFSCVGIVSFYSIAKIFCEYKKWCWKIIINTI